jgi:hypothetical protein
MTTPTETEVEALRVAWRKASDALNVALARGNRITETTAWAAFESAAYDYTTARDTRHQGDTEA